MENLRPVPLQLSYEELEELQDLLESIPSPGEPLAFGLGDKPDVGRAFRLMGRRVAYLEYRQHMDEIKIKTLMPVVKWGLTAIGTIAIAALLAGLKL